MKTEQSTDFTVKFPRPIRAMIIQSPYYKDIAKNLLHGATSLLDTINASYDVMDVPGALEIPAAISYAVEQKKYDAYIVLGCVIRGESYHFEIVCNESARKIYDAVETHNLALGNGILTVNSMQQAIDRAQKNGRNNGDEAARAALIMLQYKFQIGLVS